MASRRGCPLVKQARPDLSTCGTSAPRRSPRPRCPLRGASALLLSPTLVDSIDQQATAARCRGPSHRAKPCPTIMDGLRTLAAASRPPQRAGGRRKLLPRSHPSRLLATPWRARERSSQSPASPAGTFFVSSLHGAAFLVFSASVEVRGRRSNAFLLSLAPSLRSSHLWRSFPMTRAVAHPPPSAPIRRRSTPPHSRGRCYAVESATAGRAAASCSSRSTATLRVRRVPSRGSAAAGHAIGGPAAAARPAARAGRGAGMLGRALRPPDSAWRAMYKRWRAFPGRATVVGAPPRAPRGGVQ